MKQRGFLTEDFKQEAYKYLGRELTQKELRLYPYLCVCAIDWQRIERQKTTPEEQEIIKMLEKEKRLLREYPSYMHPTEEFYIFMQKALMRCYVITAEDYTAKEEA